MNEITRVDEVFVASRSVLPDVKVSTSRATLLREIGVSERKWGVAVKKEKDGIVTVTDNSGAVWFIKKESLMKIKGRVNGRKGKKSKINYE